MNNSRVANYAGSPGTRRDATLRGPEVKLVSSSNLVRLCMKTKATDQPRLRDIVYLAFATRKPNVETYVTSCEERDYGNEDRSF